jgi:tripartite-type tricarboxylate transporter receptor subunit TctC
VARATSPRGWSASIWRKTGQPFVVENKAGANGIVGVLSVKSAPPDGYTLMLATTSTNAANVHMYKKPGYDPRRISRWWASSATAAPSSWCRRTARYKSMADLIAYAKANPGKLNFGYFNASSQVPSEVLGKEAGVEWQGVAYKAIGNAWNDLYAGADPVHVRRSHCGARPGRHEQGAAARDLAARAQPALSRCADTCRDFSRLRQHRLPRDGGAARRCRRSIKQKLNTLINEAVFSPEITSA